MNRKQNKSYSKTLAEIANEFKFSDAVLEADEEIDDRHIIDDLKIEPELEDDSQEEKD